MKIPSRDLFVFIRYLQMCYKLNYVTTKVSEYKFLGKKFKMLSLVLGNRKGASTIWVAISLYSLRKLNVFVGVPEANEHLKLKIHDDICSRYYREYINREDEHL